ncbi:MAG TPA: hypothetical protein VHY18_05340 [Solirubrobacteraceae bacterium]|jgi:hypothetical protein|nr:hypothetical protein [Solirubrobacteraceae bacterium]
MSATRLLRRRLPAALLGLVLLAAGASVGACAGSQRHDAAKPGGAAQVSSAEEPLPTATTTSVIPPGQHVRGDGDADNPADIDGNGDSDAPRVGGPDGDTDTPTLQSHRFPDSDDGPAFAYGHRPGAATVRVITNIVKRYYTAASAGDGAVACALLPSSLARSIPDSYGGPQEPAYQRGGKTCQATLAKFFAHYHKELAAPIKLFAVRVEGETARAIFSSRTMPASGVFLAREGHAWKIVEVLGRPLP